MDKKVTIKQFRAAVSFGKLPRLAPLCYGIGMPTYPVAPNQYIRKPPDGGIGLDEGGGARYTPAGRSAGSDVPAL